METINITEGVNLRVIESDRTDYITISVFFRQPFSSKNSTASSLLALMFLSGSSLYKNRRMLEIRLEELDGAVMGSTVVKKGNEHIIQLYIKAKTEYTKEAFKILSNIIYKPIFNHELIEKSILKNIVSSQINNKRSYAFNRFMEEIYGDYNGDGFIDEVDNIDIDKYYKNVINSNLIDIITVGGKGDEIVKAAEKYIMFTPRKAMDLHCKKLKPIKDNLIEDSDVTQSKLCVGIDCDFSPKGDEYAKLIIGREIFGSGSDAILYREARENNSLCYYITARLFRFSSLMAVEAGISAENADKTINIIKQSLDYVKNTDIEKNKLELAKRSIADGYRMIKDKPDGLIGFALNQIIAQDNRNIDEVIECIENVDNIDGVFNNFNVNTFYMLRGGL